MTLPDPRHSRTDYGYHSGPDIETDMLNYSVGGSLPRMPGASATEQAMHDDLMREFADAAFNPICLTLYVKWCWIHPRLKSRARTGKIQ